MSMKVLFRTVIFPKNSYINTLLAIVRYFDLIYLR